MSRRSGGRKSRVAIRSAPLSDNLKPVHAGESGGKFKPLSEDQVDDVIENSFKILSEIGFSQPTPHCIETCQSIGAKLGTDGRLRMPREVVENAITSSTKDLVLH